MLSIKIGFLSLFKPALAPRDSEESSDDDDDDSFDTSDSSESSGSDQEMDMEHPYKYFLKDDDKPKKEETQKKKLPKMKPTKQVLKRDTDEEEESGDEWRVVAPGDGSAIEPMVQAFEKGVEITQELVLKKIMEIIANRGKRTSSIAEQICLLEQVCQKIGLFTLLAFGLK